MLTWSQNAGNPISRYLDFKHFTGEDALDPPTRETAFVTPFSKILYSSQIVFQLCNLKIAALRHKASSSEVLVLCSYK